MSSLPIGVFVLLSIVAAGTGIAVVRVARWRTAAVFAALSAAVAGTCVLAPWQGWQEMYGRSEDMRTVESSTGLQSPFLGEWVLLLVGVACVVAGTLATRDAPPSSRSGRAWAFAGTLALIAAAGLTAHQLLYVVDRRRFEGAAFHQPREGVAELGIYVALLASGFASLSMLGVFLRLPRGPPGRER